MLDVQNMPDERQIDIQRVGLKDVHLPFQIKMKDASFQHVQGIVNIAVTLPHQFKGTHLSRFMEILMRWNDKPISIKEIRLILKEVCADLDALESELNLQFRYFLPAPAPISKVTGYLDYRCTFNGIYNKQSDQFLHYISTAIPVTSLCPCSKEISEFGAHNQRAIIHAKVCSDTSAKILWLEELIELLRTQGSCPIYPVLKRPDEKFVTEAAYLNPKFVEDILRDSVLALRSESRIKGFRVEVESYESIHNHSAFASHVEGEI